MATENEPAKLLLPYLQRADELQKHEPLVAYYCRLYAMEKGLKVPQSERTKTTNALLVSLMKQLEKDKKSLKLGPDDNLHIEGFALNVFAKADKQDRAGRADINTAKTFYAASIFFEILNQFGPLQPDLEQKQKYAVWKAADIRKAIKDGRKPVAGPPSGDEDLSLPSNKSTHDQGLGENVDSHPQMSPDPSPQFYEKVDHNRPSTISPSPSFHDKMNHPSTTNSSHPTNFYDDVNSNIPPSPPIYQRTNYNSHEFHPPPSNEPDNSTYSQSYHQPYPQEPQHLPHNLPHETSPYNYPHFQSYPSFTDSTLPSVPSQSLPPAPSHSPTYYQGSDSFYTSQQIPNANYPSVSHNHTSVRDGGMPSERMPSEPGPSAPKSYQYNSEYMPPPEKIAEAHKAARFAVGALAFDDVSVAVDYLIKSLDLLTNPSAGH